MNRQEQLDSFASRRAFLTKATSGIGAAAMATMLDPTLARAGVEATDASAARGVWSPLHFVPKAKRVIFLSMAGGPSHLETFDYKPKLAEMHGQPMPESFTKGQPIAQLQGAQLTCFAPHNPFRKCGQSGQEISEIFPHLATVADEIAIVHSM